MKSRIMTAVAMAAALVLGGCGVFANPARSGGSISDSGPEETGGIGVNAYLWRATLDTLSFMPLASADPWGGVVNTDWYSDPKAPGERFKVTVYILDTRLRADGISAAVSREVKTPEGAWATGSTSPDTRIAIENAILQRARELRLSTIENEE